jgi:hypothetical protein
VSFFPHLDRLNLDQLIQSFEDHVPESESYLCYSEIALLIREKGPDGIAFLRSMGRDADEAMLRLTGGS